MCVEGVSKKHKIGEHSGHLLGFEVMLYCRFKMVEAWLPNDRDLLLLKPGLGCFIV